MVAPNLANSEEEIASAWIKAFDKETVSLATASAWGVSLIWIMGIPSPNAVRYPSGEGKDIRMSGLYISTTLVSSMIESLLVFVVSSHEFAIDLKYSPLVVKAIKVLKRTDKGH